jgi:hypothetical protein
VRGTHGQRPNPAEAVPGIRPEDRQIARENAAVPPTPRGGAVRGTMGKPQLPRRRAQEHIAPQLRDGPAPRQDMEYVVGHDPGLMAAFQRGIGLAEAAHAETERTQASPVQTSSPRDRAPLDLVRTDELPPLEVVRVEGPPVGGAHADGAHMDNTHMERPHMDNAHMERPHIDHAHMERRHTGRPHLDVLRMDGVAQADGPSSAGATSSGVDPMDVPPTDAAATAHLAEAHTAHATAPHEAQGTRDTAPAPGHDLTARHDGSTPAG